MDDPNTTTAATTLETAPPTPLHGLIVREQSGFFWVETTAHTEPLMCRLRGRLLEQAQSADVAAIGDRVRVADLGDGTGAIEAVEERATALSRAARTSGARGSGDAVREHVIIANPQQALFVVAAAQPTPDFKVLDRLLVVAEAANIPAIGLVVNKADLVTPDAIDALFAPYHAMGYPLIITSAITGQGIDAVRAALADKLSVLSGPSGVGKSSLLNAIVPGLNRSTKAVAGVAQEGQHTTRDSALIRVDASTYLADTPGMRGLLPYDVEPEELDGYFRDLAALVPDCRFANCTHHREQGCAVLAAVADGRVARHRHKNYLALWTELDALVVGRDSRVRRKVGL